MKKSHLFKKIKKTQKHIRKMNGGNFNDIRNYLTTKFTAIYGPDPFNNNREEERKLSMIENSINAINIINKQYNIPEINNKYDLINFMKDNKTNPILDKMFDRVLIDFLLIQK